VLLQNQSVFDRKILDVGGLINTVFGDVKTCFWRYGKEPAELVKIYS